jgi:hypothetical protein
MQTWPCTNEKCLNELKEWLESYDDDEEAARELHHCAMKDCHNVVWCEKGLACTICEKWYCIGCWQHSGKHEDDETWTCDYCLNPPIEKKSDNLDWPCDDPECLAEFKSMIDDHNRDMLDHCTTQNCHGTYFTSEGALCLNCAFWHCENCICNNDDGLYCPSCRGVGLVPPIPPSTDRCWICSDEPDPVMNLRIVCASCDSWCCENCWKNEEKNGAWYCPACRDN